MTILLYQNATMQSYRLQEKPRGRCTRRELLDVIPNAKRPTHNIRPDGRADGYKIRPYSNIALLALGTEVSHLFHHEF